jgi:hypothetical protein
MTACPGNVFASSELDVPCLAWYWSLDKYFKAVDELAESF